VSFEEFSKNGKEFTYAYKFAMGENPLYYYTDIGVRKTNPAS
jgi:hypothetical protein